VYSAAKTVTDCFRFRNRIGIDVVLEALKEYMKRPDADILELQQHARINRVEKVMHPYLEILV
jgi:hypothetical protein